jgi:hypothetical protein
VISSALLGTAILNAGWDFASSAEYRVASAAGAPEALCGCVALSADVRTLVDVEALWGAQVAVWLPLVATLGTTLVGLIAGIPSLPALSSPLLTGWVWLLRKESECS